MAKLNRPGSTFPNALKNKTNFIRNISIRIFNKNVEHFQLTTTLVACANRLSTLSLEK